MAILNNSNLSHPGSAHFWCGLWKRLGGPDTGTNIAGV